ncbi:MAG: hypothetical protein P4M11_14790 [Candidatus Pacebacteria bacterium]|nr:hypothetical protein [Candidatus Paceibacterota bacterium]
MQLVESIERLSYLEGLLEENINNLVVESLAVEQSEIEVYNQGVAGSSYTRKQTYSTAVQEYLVHALNVASYTSLSALQSLCAQDCDDFNRSAYYILVNGFTDLKDTSEKSVNVAYDLFSVSTGDDKNVLFSLASDR